MITLVMGLTGSGKTYLLDALPLHITVHFSCVTMAGIKRHRGIDNCKNVVLNAEYASSSYYKRELVNTAKYLSKKGKHVYIHCYPAQYKWLNKVFTDDS